MVSSNARLRERLDALEDEVDLLKTEIRQTLIDMREAWIQREDVLSAPRRIEVESEPVVMEASREPSPPVRVSASSAAAPVVAESGGSGVSHFGLDLSVDHGSKSIVNDIMEWMGSAKEKGITAARLFPILEAYESSGMMSPLMVRFIMKSMAMLDEIEIGGNGKSISPVDYSASLSDLHRLVCISIDSSR